jgi:hypothetical protein
MSLVFSFCDTFAHIFTNPKATRGLEPISYRGMLVSTLLHATVYMFLHNLLNVLVQIADKMGLQKNIHKPFTFFFNLLSRNSHGWLILPLFRLLTSEYSMIFIKQHEKLLFTAWHKSSIFVYYFHLIMNILYPYSFNRSYDFEEGSERCLL